MLPGGVGGGLVVLGGGCGVRTMCPLEVPSMSEAMLFVFPSKKVTRVIKMEIDSLILNMFFLRYSVADVGSSVPDIEVTSYG